MQYSKYVRLLIAGLCLHLYSAIGLFGASWTITDLGAGRALAINDSTNTTIIVGYDSTLSTDQAVYWEEVNGTWTRTVLAGLGAHSLRAESVNDSGDIVGAAVDTEPDPCCPCPCLEEEGTRAVFWDRSASYAATKIHVSPDAEYSDFYTEYSWAYGINDQSNGKWTGIVQPATDDWGTLEGNGANAGTKYLSNLISDLSNGELTDPWTANSYAINEDNYIVGDHWDSASYNACEDTWEGRILAFIKSHGSSTFTSLTSLRSGADADATSTAFAINIDEVVVGRSAINGDPTKFHAVKWTDVLGTPTATDLGVLTNQTTMVVDTTSAAYGINDSNPPEIVGASYTTGGIGGKAFYHDGTLQDLILNLGSGHGWTELHIATDINNQGWIVGWGLKSGAERSFLIKQ